MTQRRHCPGQMASGAGPYLKCVRQRKISRLFHTPTDLGPCHTRRVSIDPGTDQLLPAGKHTRSRYTTLAWTPSDAPHPCMSGQYRHHMATSASHPTQGKLPMRPRRPNHNAASNSTPTAPLLLPSGRRTMWWPSHWSRVLTQSRLRNRAIRLGRHRPGRANRCHTKSYFLKT
jgi:hypothetical protein